MSVNGDTISISIPAAKGATQNGEVWLCPITRTPVTIGRGENNGHIHHLPQRRAAL